MPDYEMPCFKILSDREGDKCVKIILKHYADGNNIS